MAVALWAVLRQVEAIRESVSLSLERGGLFSLPRRPILNNSLIGLRAKVSNQSSLQTTKIRLKRLG